VAFLKYRAKQPQLVESQLLTLVVMGLIFDVSSTKTKGTPFALSELGPDEIA